MMVKRIWKQTTDELQTENGVLEIWDGGSRRYERWPDGTECCWEVVRKEFQENCLTEVLKELPSWDTPAVTMWHETIPVFIPEGDKEFQIPGWSVTYLRIPEAQKHVAQSTTHMPTPNTQRYKRQPDNATNQNLHRRFHKKKPHMGSGPRHALDDK
jgi:hypothetical protein